MRHRALKSGQESYDSGEGHRAAAHHREADLGEGGLDEGALGILALFCRERAHATHCFNERGVRRVHAKEVHRYRRPVAPHSLERALHAVVAGRSQQKRPPFARAAHGYRRTKRSGLM